MTNKLDATEQPKLNPSLLNDNIVELSMLIPGRQAAALEATAASQGMTVGELLRRLVQDFFHKFAQPRPA
jgi:hypothetical protein